MCLVFFIHSEPKQNVIIVPLSEISLPWRGMALRREPRTLDFDSFAIFLSRLTPKQRFTQYQRCMRHEERSDRSIRTGQETSTILRDDPREPRLDQELGHLRRWLVYAVEP